MELERSPRRRAMENRIQGQGRDPYGGPVYVIDEYPYPDAVLYGGDVP